MATEIRLFRGVGSSFVAFVLILFAFVLPPEAAHADVTSLAQNWSQESPTTSPPARWGAGMAFDADSGKVVLFGGDNEDQDVSIFDDTWTWDGSDWTQETPPSSPPGSVHAEHGLQCLTGTTILFGGDDNNPGQPLSNETWTWDGSTWTQLSPATSPPGRYGGSLWFDSTTGNMVLFGGQRIDGKLNDTWTWDGTNWTEMAPSTEPAPRFSAGMAFDSSAGNLVLFGGLDDNVPNTALNDTWTWDGTDWTQHFPSTSPSPRYGASMEFDPVAGNVLLFGGNNVNDTRNETWVWDGTDWSQQSPRTSPPVRLAASMAFDPVAGNMLLFGGGDTNGTKNDTWTFGLQPDPPTADISSPADGSNFTVGTAAPTGFSCEESANGPGLTTCKDSNGDTSPGSLDTGTAGPHTYSVTATSEDGLTGSESIAYTVDKAVPQLTSFASPDATVGEKIFARAYLDNGHNLTGTVGLTLFGPDDPTCTGKPAYNYTAPVNDEGTYDTPGFEPAKVGEYRWVASYSGDQNNVAYPGKCSTAPTVKISPQICPPVKVHATSYKPATVGKGRTAPGVRARITVSQASSLDVSTRLTFMLKGKNQSADLGSRKLTSGGTRNLRLLLPSRLRKDLPYRKKVTLNLKVTTSATAAKGCISPPTIVAHVTTQVVRIVKAQAS